jgi:adenylate cyclase
MAVSQISLILHNLGHAESEQSSDRQIIPYKVLRAVGESLEPETVAYIAVETIADLTDWPTVAISTPNSEGKLVIRAAVGVPFTDEGINGRAFRTGHTQILPDPDDPFPQFAAYGMPQSALAVPLRRGRQQLGVLNVESDEIEAFDAEDILLAESLADAIVLALDNARLFSQAQSRLTEQTVLRKAMSVITSTLDLNTVLYSLAEQMGQVMNATSAYICSYDAEQATTTVLANYFGPRSSDQERASDVSVTYSLPDTFPGTMAYLEMGEPLLAYVDDPNIPATKRQYMLSFGGFTSLVIPLQAGGKTIAYTEIWESQERREYSPEEIHLCQDIAQQAAVTIENARLFKGIADERGRLQALIESDRDGIILISVQGQILVINQPALAFMHMKETPDYWIKRPVMSMIKHLRRHAPPLAQTAVTEMRRMGLDGQVVDRAGVAAGRLMDGGCGIVGEQRVFAAGQP